MGWLLSICLLFLISCASRPSRTVASLAPVEIHTKEIDAKQSRVQAYYQDEKNPGKQLFYLELRDAQNQLADAELTDFMLKSGKQKLDFLVRRWAQGKYQVELPVANNSTGLQFLVQGKKLNYQSAKLPSPDAASSRLEIISNLNHVLRMRLTLKDRTKNFLELKLPPEIILEGSGQISDLEKTGDGTWEFELSYPEENQIMYFSIRANGIYLERLLRYQHVEK
jgi:hypothetical protein